VARRAAANRSRNRSAAHGLKKTKPAAGMWRAALTAWKVLCYGVGIFVVALACVQGWFYAHVLWWKTHDPDSTSFMQARLEQLRRKTATRS
jgi:hypothetical protein